MISTLSLETLVHQRAATPSRGVSDRADVLKSMARSPMTRVHHGIDWIDCTTKFRPDRAHYQYNDAIEISLKRGSIRHLESISS